MNPEIEALNARVETGADWTALRYELAARYAEAQTQAQHVKLLECYHVLLAAGPRTFDADTWAELEPVAWSGYKAFLNHEAMEGGEAMNPALLAYIAAREVEAGRLSHSDSFAEYAATGAALGDTAGTAVPLRRLGDWLFYGATGGAVVTWLLVPAGLSPSPLWLVPAGLLVGWMVNERERKTVQAHAVGQRVARGYPAELS